MPNIPRLQQQIQFLTEIDKLKQVLRRTWLLDQSRYENDAEHSWHIAMAAILFLEYADDPKVNLLRVIKMLLVHDLVEIDAGDPAQVGQGTQLINLNLVYDPWVRCSLLDTAAR